jgi:23S rRNA (guanine745-N1)-methyltransferase
MRAMTGADLLICPICGERLAPAGNAFVCARRHAFDRAREGYVNLLRSKRTGDSKQMLLARRAFLERGYYAPLARAVCEHLREHLEARTQGNEGDEAPAILDAGCGEGYYLARVMEELQGTANVGSLLYLGLDSAKDAVRLASKRCTGAFFVVADIQERLPFAEGSFQVLLNLFAPRQIAEFARTLAPGGLLLCVIPAPEHLIELRERLGLLAIEEQKLERLTSSLQADFAGVAARHLTYSMQPGAEDVLHLVEMTPNSRHADRWSRAAVERMADTPITAAFIVLSCRRRPYPAP